MRTASRKRRLKLTFAVASCLSRKYLIDTENSTGNTTVTFSGDAFATYLSGWLLSAGSGANNTFNEDVIGGTNFQNGLVVQGFQTANINSDVTVAESTVGGISAGGSNANSLSIEQSPSGLVQVNAINLADGVSITGSSGNINLTGSALVLAGIGTQSISAGGTATNTFFGSTSAEQSESSQFDLRVRGRDKRIECFGQWLSEWRRRDCSRPHFR